MEIAIVDDLQSDKLALYEFLSGWLTENRLEEKIHMYADGERLTIRLAKWGVRAKDVYTARLCTRMRKEEL